LSALFFMRRTGLFALMLLAVAVASAAGLHARPAEARRKAAVGSRNGSRAAAHSRTNSLTRSKTGLKAGLRAGRPTAARSGLRRPITQAGRGVRLRTSARTSTIGRERRIRYSRGRWPVALGAAADSRYPASQEPEVGEGDAAALTEPDAAAVGDSARLADSTKTLGATALSQTTETETRATPPIDQVASLNLSGLGRAAPLRGSLASLERQNDRLEADSLERILDEADLASRIEHGLLVPLPASAALTVNPNLTENHRYCRPWTARFLADLARAHQAAFHDAIQVNSAVRTVEYQKRLMRTNGNAAGAEGDIVSPHLTGATIDIAKQGLTGKEMSWMRRQLLGLQLAGKIDVEEEFAQACFHITVYKSYVGMATPRETVQPAVDDAGAARKAARPGKRKPASQLPADLATGLLPATGR